VLGLLYIFCAVVSFALGYIIGSVSKEQAIEVIYPEIVKDNTYSLDKPSKALRHPNKALVKKAISQYQLYSEADNKKCLSTREYYY